MPKLFSILITCFFISGCSISNKSFSDAKAWIPENFNPNRDFLLIERFDITKRSNAEMQEFLQKHYTGHYAIEDRETIMSKRGKYGDFNKYRFAFLWALRSKDHPGGAAGSGSVLQDIDPYGSFYDRSIDKKYPSTRKINNYGNKAYIPFFNSIMNNSK